MRFFCGLFKMSLSAPICSFVWPRPARKRIKFIFVEKITIYRVFLGICRVKFVYYTTDYITKVYEVVVTIRGWFSNFEN